MATSTPSRFLSAARCFSLEDRVALVLGDLKRFDIVFGIVEVAARLRIDPPHRAHHF
jgi:hypothetical protein